MKRSPLKSDPASVAAFVARGRAKGLKRTDRAPTPRSTLKRPTGLRTRRPKRAVVVPPEIREAVFARNGGWCVWARHKGHRWRAAQIHHLLPRQTWPQYVAEPLNLVGLSALLHMQHEHSPNDRLPWAALPRECQAFLRDVCASDARAARFVQTKYPGADGDSVKLDEIRAISEPTKQGGTQ